MNSFGKILILLAFGLIGLQGSGQTTNDKAYSVFTYNFIKYANWSGTMASGDIKVFFVGSSKVYEEFKEVASLKTIKGRKMVVNHIDDINSLKACHVIYISENRSSLLGKIIDKTVNSHTLILTERENLTKKGAAISFILLNNKLKFQINDAALAQRKIKIASSLRTLAYNGK